MLTRAAFLWVIFAALMGFAVGGSFVWSFQKIPQSRQIEHSQTYSNKHSDDHDITKTFWERLSIIWDRTWEDPVAFYTFVLGIFTALLAVISATQIAFLFRADKTTRNAAEAAKRSADVAARVELPFLALKRAALFANGQAVTLGTVLPLEIEPFIWFTNWGRSPAQITHGCIEWSLINKLPPSPKYTNIIAYAPGIALIHRSDIIVDVPCKITLTPSQVIAIDTLQENIWIFGFIGFKDFLGESHDVRFCLKWVPHPHGERSPTGFVWDDETPAEYTRRT